MPSERTFFGERDSPPPRAPRPEREESDRRTSELALSERMRHLVAGVTYREISGRTGVHPETVRRYFNSGRPSVYFIAALCKAFNADPEWLLCGGASPNAGPIHEVKAIPSPSPTEDAAAEGPRISGDPIAADPEPIPDVEG